MGLCFLERLSGGAGVPCTAFLGRGGDFVADYMDLNCGLPLIGLSTRPRGNFLAASAATPEGHHAQEFYADLEI